MIASTSLTPSGRRSARHLQGQTELEMSLNDAKVIIVVGSGGGSKGAAIHWNDRQIMAY